MEISKPIADERLVVQQTFLSQGEMVEIYEECNNLNPVTSNVVNKLLGIVKTLKERMYSDSVAWNLTEDVERAMTLSRGLKNVARKYNALKFFYFGVYHAQIELLHKELKQKFAEGEEQCVVTRKHFSGIMQALYKNQTCKQSELARILNIDRGNLSHEMDRIVDIGYVEQRKVGKFKYYNLSPAGYQYYNTYLRMASQLERRESIEIKKDRKDNIKNYFSDITEKKLGARDNLLIPRTYVKKKQLAKYISAAGYLPDDMYQFNHRERMD